MRHKLSEFQLSRGLPYLNLCSKGSLQVLSQKCMLLDNASKHFLSFISGCKRVVQVRGAFGWYVRMSSNLAAFFEDLI